MCDHDLDVARRARDLERYHRNYASYCTSMVRFGAYSWLRCRFRR